MESSFQTKVMYAVVGFAISVGGIYYMAASLNKEWNEGVRAHLESPKHGPLDEALAKAAGMEDILAKKPKWEPEVVSPLEFSSVIGTLERHRD